MADLEGGTALSLDRHLGASDTAEAIESYTEIEIPESLRDNLVLYSARLSYRPPEQTEPTSG